MDALELFFLDWSQSRQPVCPGNDKGGTRVGLGSISRQANWTKLVLVETEVQFCQDIMEITCSSLNFILLEIHNDFMIKNQKFLAFHFCFSTLIF